ncbi:hypothetical protein THRCLA_00247, partial [Thraustotheca clavata]
MTTSFRLLAILPLVYGACDEQNLCSTSYVPVCTTNGITYNNLCLMEQAQCVDSSITLQAEGPCEFKTKACPTTCDVMTSYSIHYTKSSTMIGEICYEYIARSKEMLSTHSHVAILEDSTAERIKPTKAADGTLLQPLDTIISFHVVDNDSYLSVDRLKHVHTFLSKDISS